MATSKLDLLYLPVPTIRLSTMALPEAINLEISFPSLFFALGHLKEDPYETEWLLGLVSNIAYVLIIPRVLCADVDTRLAHVRGHAAEYLLTSTAFYGVWPVIDIDEVANVVRIIHDFYVLTASPTSSAVTMSTEQRRVVKDIKRILSILRIRQWLRNCTMATTIVSRCLCFSGSGATVSHFRAEQHI